LNSKLYFLDLTSLLTLVGYLRRRVFLKASTMFNHSLGRGDRGAVWFGFEHKSHPNRKIKMHAVRFGSVGF
jgi:hypothetical protein